MIPKFMFLYWWILLLTFTQPTITRSKIPLETLEQGVKYVQSQQQRHQNDAIGFIVNIEHISHLVLVFLLVTLNV